MTLLTANRLGKSYGGQACFCDVSFVIPAGARIGLIGPNGCGKTTLFRVLAGEEDYDGDISRRRGLEVIRLEQSPRFPSGSTPRSIMADAMRPWRELDTAIDAFRENLAALPSEEQVAAMRQLGHLESRWEAGGGESAQRRSEALLRGVGISQDQFDQDIHSMSGGERCRAALAKLLLNEPDIWLLDEPTNHLDLSGITFLERFIANSTAAVMVISHDRRFLDKITGDTWELEGGGLFYYPGNYSQSRKLREERRKLQWRVFMEQREFMRRTEFFINKWRAGTRSRQAQSRLKRLAKIERMDEPISQSRLAALDLKLDRRLGDIVMEAENLEVGFPDRRLFAKLNLSLVPGEVLGIVGPNGSGKTSFFRTLLAELPPLAGSFRWGATADIGTLGQHEAFPNQARTPLQYLQDAGLGADDQDRRDKLGAMLFSGDAAAKPIQVLSGGEKKRLMLTRLLLKGHNVLLLDEPTNHLDIHSSEAVTLALSAYPGTVLTISHDRFFLDEVADRVLWLEDGAWRITRGGFVEAEEDQLRAGREKDALRKSGSPPGRRKRSAPAGHGKGGSPGIGWSVAKLEKHIIANEERLAQIHAAFEDPATVRDGGRMRLLQVELTALEKEQAELEMEYARRG